MNVMRFISVLIDRVFRISSRSSISLFVLISLPVIFITVFNYTYSDWNLTKLTYNTFRQTAITTSFAVTERLNDLTRLGSSFANNPKFRNSVNEGRWDEAALIVDIYKNLNDEQFVDLIFLSDPQGNVKSASPAAPDVIEKNFAYRDWYKGAISGGQPYVSEVYSRANAPSVNVVAVATPIIGENYEVTGILVFQVRLEHFLDITNQVSVGRDGLVYIVDQRGKIVASPAYPPQDKIINVNDRPEVKNVLAGKAEVTQMYDIEGVTGRLVAYQPNRYHWGVLVEQPLDKAFTERQAIRLTFTLIFIFTLFINGILVALLKTAIRTDGSRYR